MVYEDLFRPCCELTGHAVSGIDRRGRWYFNNAIVDRARAILGRASTET